MFNTEFRLVVIAQIKLGARLTVFESVFCVQKFIVIQKCLGYRENQIIFLEICAACRSKILKKFNCWLPKKYVSVSRKWDIQKFVFETPKISVPRMACEFVGWSLCFFNTCHKTGNFNKFWESMNQIFSQWFYVVLFVKKFYVSFSRYTRLVFGSSRIEFRTIHPNLERIVLCFLHPKKQSWKFWSDLKHFWARTNFWNTKYTYKNN